jgi:oligopeptide transport system substrate-binding protein
MIQAPRTAALARLFPSLLALGVVALVALVALAATGCRPRQTAVEAARATQTLHLGNGAEPGDLDPHLATAFVEFNILLALGEGLTAIDETTGQPVPATAASWDVSADGLRYVFRLRPDAKWSNGEPVRAADFLFSFERILRPALASEYAYMLFPVRGAEDFNAGKTTDFASVGFSAPDERTIVVELAAPTPYFLGLVAHQAWFPVHPPTILKHGTIDQRGTAWTRPENFVGNGAYRLAVWVPNDRLEVVRQPHHHSDPKQGLQRVVFYPTDNIPADEAAYRAGQRHVTYDLLPDRIATHRAQSPSPLRVDPLLETLYLRFNTTRKPLDDVRVRRALALALDREAIATSVLQGSRLPAHHYVPPRTGGFESQARQPHDPEAARALLAAAGFPGGRDFPRLEVLMNTDALNTRILEAIQAMWKRELGVDVALVSQDFRVYLDAMKGLRYDIARARWIGDYDDPNTYLDLFLTGGGNNQTGWSSPAYDALIAAAARSPEPAARFAAFQQAEALLLDEAPIAPLVFGARVHLVHPEVLGWRPSLLGVRRYQTLQIAP